MITNEDVSMLRYFWDTKGDITCWCGWEDFQKRNPLMGGRIGRCIQRIEDATMQIRLLIGDLTSDESDR